MCACVRPCDGMMCVRTVYAYRYGSNRFFFFSFFFLFHFFFFFLSIPLRHVTAFACAYVYTIYRGTPPRQTALIVVRIYIYIYTHYTYKHTHKIYIIYNIIRIYILGICRVRGYSSSCGGGGGSVQTSRTYDLRRHGTGVSLFFTAVRPARIRVCRYFIHNIVYIYVYTYIFIRVRIRYLCVRIYNI